MVEAVNASSDCAMVILRQCRRRLMETLQTGHDIPLYAHMSIKAIRNSYILTYHDGPVTFELAEGSITRAGRRPDQLHGGQAEYW